MRAFLLVALVPLALGACARDINGLLVSPDAHPVGGNLFVETLDRGGQLLVLDGEITPETSYAFLALLKRAEVGGLLIAQSPGGDLFASHQIGEAIAERGMNTAVLVSCLSACVDIFIAGRERAMGEEAELGLHAASDPETGYEVDKPYWRRFGFGAVNEAAYTVPFGDLWVIDAEQARELRLATEILK